MTHENSWERARRERDEAQAKLDAIKGVLIELAQTDPEFWTPDQMDVAINKIDNILDPEDSIFAEGG